MKSLLCATALAMGLLASTTNAGNFTINRSTDEVIDFTGDIELGDEVKLENVLTYKPYRAIRLNSPGGNVYAGIMMAKSVRAHNMGTILGEGDRCASMCALVYTAGILRGFASSAGLGVHSAESYDPSQGLNSAGIEDDGAKATTTNLARLYKYYGMPDSIIGKMITTPGDQITWLATSDLLDEGFSKQIGQPEAPIVTGSISPAQSVHAAKWTMSCQNSKGEYYQVTLFSDYTLQVHNTTYQVAEWHWSKKESGALVATGTTENNNKFAAIFRGPNPRFLYNVGKPNACSDN
jgi:hypothetical protein